MHSSVPGSPYLILQIRFPLMPPTIRPLPRAFFSRDPRRVARALLGKVLVRDAPPLIARIVEVEAYLGANDPAAHSPVGKTAPNAVMFGPPGSAYIYFFYPNHHSPTPSSQPAPT